MADMGPPSALDAPARRMPGPPASIILLAAPASTRRAPAYNARGGGAPAMTEAERLACIAPAAMLLFVGRLGARKSRLFVAACCRRIWHLLPDAASRAAVSAAEAYADGRLDLAGLRAAALAVFEKDLPPAKDTAFLAVTTTGAYNLAALSAAGFAARAVAGGRRGLGARQDAPRVLAPRNVRSPLLPAVGVPALRRPPAAAADA